MSYLKSLILSKWVMALTGIVLVGFLLGHTIGNLQIFMGSDTFNHYAAFLQGLGEILWIMRIVLILSVVLHIITSIKLKLGNNAAKPVAYKYKSYLTAKLTSRNMIWTGLMILAFLVYHLLHFTVGSVHSEYYNFHEPVVMEKTALAGDTHGMPLPPEIKTTTQKGVTYAIQEEVKVAETRHDVYKMVVTSFREPLISICYIIGVILLAFHLTHAIQSAFQTLGLNHPRYFGHIVTGSNVISILIAIGLISIPLSILTGIVGGAV